MSRRLTTGGSKKMAAALLLVLHPFSKAREVTIEVLVPMSEHKLSQTFTITTILGKQIWIETWPNFYFIGGHRQQSTKSISERHGGSKRNGSGIVACPWSLFVKQEK
jgi:hypothetical protein